MFIIFFLFYNYIFFMVFKYKCKMFSNILYFILTKECPLKCPLKIKKSCNLLFYKTLYNFKVARRGI